MAVRTYEDDKQGGDQLTNWAGWQEGAILAAQEAVRAIDRQTRPAAN